ncbi:MAG: spore germination protein [Oscillospiraceae bacterium]|nr:spore germination protein [Oscillospiraceae bacterium]
MHNRLNNDLKIAKGKMGGKMYSDLQQNILELKKLLSDSADFTVRTIKLNNDSKTSCAIFTTEGMCDKESLAIYVLNPLLNAEYGDINRKKLFDYIYDKVLSASEITLITSFSEVITFSMSGFAIVAIDGYKEMVAIGAQGFSFRGVSEPESEVVQRGSREGFTEALRINMTLVRRRMKNPNLVFETMTLGTESNTQICLCYIKNVATKSSVSEIRERLSNCNLKTLLGSGYLVPYLEDSGKNEVFTGVGVTERPDSLCGKMLEGRIGILIDGTPCALVIPHLFVENFQSVDDYSNRPYFATIIRLLKYFSYILAILTPAVYIAFVNFHPDYFPKALYKNIQESIKDTPLPLILEILLITFIYEVMREAGLRLPKALGHAVSIVGALVIGDCAINAGIIGAPTLMAVAVSAICSYVVPDLYPQITVLRLSFIVAGGIMGVWGIVLLSTIVIISMCSKSSLGVAYMSPIIPFNKRSIGDIFVRFGWKKLTKNSINVQSLNGGSVYEE